MTSSENRERRPAFQHAGEVTKAKKAKYTAEDSAEEPPAFGGPKIGGAPKIFDPTVGSSLANNDTTMSTFANLGGVRIEDASLKGSVPVANETRWNAPPGWRRIWRSVGQDEWQNWIGDPEIVISRFCKRCAEQGRDCPEVRLSPSCATYDVPLVCENCQRDGQSPCLRLISYCPNQFEDLDINRIPDYAARHFARTYRNQKGTPLEVFTCMPGEPERVSNRNLLYRNATPVRPHAEIKQPASDRPATAPRQLPRPTYSDVRRAYERIAEQRYRDGCGKRRDRASVSRSAPFWEIDTWPRYPSGEAYLRGEEMRKERRSQQMTHWSGQITKPKHEQSSPGFAADRDRGEDVGRRAEALPPSSEPDDEWMEQLRAYNDLRRSMEGGGDGGIYGHNDTTTA